MAEFHDAAVSGADAVDSRPGFTAMLERIEGNGVRTIIVETASRFARDLMVQEVGHAKLRERGIDLIAADNPGSFIDDTPLAKVVAVTGALLSAPVAYIAYSASQNGDNGNHYGQIKNGNNGNHNGDNVHGAPCPLAGAGAMGLLVAGGVFWLMRRKRRAI